MTTVDRALAAIEASDDDAVLIGFDPDRVDRRDRRGPLAGEAIVVKDCVGVPGHPTTGGSPVLADHRLAVGGGVQRLLDAGAVIVATASMHELAFGVTGRNDWRGMPINPAAPDRLPGGSSSGSAVAVAAGIVDVAIGTDTGGSCRIPAACCGVVGFRPSTGRYPDDGLLTLSASRDTIGVLATTIGAVARFDAVLAGESVAELPPVRPVTTIAIADEAAIERFDHPVAAAYRAWVDRCRERGIETVPVDLEPLLGWDDEASFPIALRETILAFRTRAGELGLDYDEFVARLAGDDVRALMGAEVPSEAARNDALTRVVPLMQAWYDEALATADVVAVPTMPVVPPGRDEHDEMTVGGHRVATFPTMARLTSPASLAGVPSLSVPIGDRSSPVAVMLEGRRNDDRGLLAAAGFLAGFDTIYRPGVGS